MMAAHRRQMDVDELGEEGVEDMINLLSLNEENLLKNIRLRYDRQLIYTYTGSILVAVNPYRMFNIYGLDVVKQYEDAMLGSQPPHLFAIGSASFQKMNKDLENQVIIISGESGAGKTESTKLLMQYLAAVNRSGTSIVTERILEANPLLESFGNAKTIRNDNSSRFGKYVQLYFKGQPRGSIVGATTSEYLLEKSRIVTQAADERNYHVFYELLCGLSEDAKMAYGLTTAEKYYYLNQGGSCKITSKNDCNDFQDLQAALEVLSFTEQEQNTIYKILAAVLHLGNIYFIHEPNEFQQECVTISPEGSDAETKWVCHLLQLDEGWLREALTKKITEARHERLITPLNTEQAQDARDAVAKALYHRLFTWLVEKINAIVKGPVRMDNTNQRDKIVSIAILDIFGFEDFRSNSFEQLCINYANEALQLYFNKHIFKQEQQEYAKERISWTNISFHDNQPIIDLIASKPSGIIHILDDESNFPKGTDQSFLEKCHYTHHKNPLYEKPRMSSPEFSIKHYAGKVTYHVKNFLDKNRDTLRADVIQLLIQSNNELISKMFQELRDSVVTKTISKMSGLYVTMKPKTPTVAASFHESLLNLIDNMAKCNPWFVRCIKPNNHKMAMVFEQDVVLTQLRYTGMLETIHIRKMGFPVRYKFYNFATKYFVLLSHAERKSACQDDRLISEKVLHSLGDEWDDSWQIGLNKVFLREKLGYHLDEKRNTVVRNAAIRIQKFSRGFTARKTYQRKRSAAITIQAGLRGWMQRSQYSVIRRGIIQAQAQYRMLQQRKKYLKMLENQQQAKEEGWNHVPRENRVEDMRQRIERQGAEVNKIDKTHLKQADNRIPQKTMPGINTVSQLEIPRDLANIFRQLPDCYPVHTEQHNIIRLTNIQPQLLNLILQDDIDSFAFSKYANVYFQSHKWRMRKHVITEPFLKDSNTKEAVAVFKLIMRYMYDTNQSERQQQLIGNYIIQKGLANDSLCDEIYVQLVNQTWLNKNEEAKRRGWMLMAACLSCFPPSGRLNKFLLKYVSDHGYRDYKIFCQHKLLECINVGPEQKRTYPPCLLEWKVIKETGCMAAQGIFTDGIDKKISHLEPWTTAEEFACYLLQLRGIREGHHGWTILLREENDFYEYAGYDYVMDLISEMELEPDFPHNWSYYITGMMRPTEGSSIRREAKRHPHNAEDARLLELSKLGIHELLTPVEAEPRQSLDPEEYFKYNSLSSDTSLYSSLEPMLSDSKLNKRKPKLDPSLAVDSVLNMRYTKVKRQAPAVPADSNASLAEPVGQNHNSFIEDDLPISTDSRLNKRYLNRKNPLPDDLADSRLNMRYNEQKVQRDGNEELSNGIIHPYVKNTHQQLAANGHLDHTAKDHILRQKRSSKIGSNSLDIDSLRSTLDMDQWVDNLFLQVLNGNLDDLTDARLLEQKMKGGGELNQPAYGTSVVYPAVHRNQPVLNLTNNAISPPQAPSVLLSTNIPVAPPGVPIAAVPQVPAPSLTYMTPNVQLPVPAVPPVQPPVLTPPVLSIPADPLHITLQQQATQDAIREQHVKVQLIQTQQLQQQTASLQAQLQQQQLQTQILQQSVQTEILKHQLKELQNKEDVLSPLTTKESSSTVSPHKADKSQGKKPVVVERTGKQGEIDDSRPGGVQTLKRTFEQKITPVRSPLAIASKDLKNSSSPESRGVQFSEQVETIPGAEQREHGTSGLQSPPSASPSPPPPPPPPEESYHLTVPVGNSPSPLPPPLPSPPPASSSVQLPVSSAASLTISSPSPQSIPTSSSQPHPAASMPKNCDTPEALQNMFIEIVDEQLDKNKDPVQRPPLPPPPPPPPPPQSTTTTTVTSNTTTTPPTAVESENKKGSKGVAGDVVRVGKIQWPPPPKEVPPKEVHVGKLVIQESPTTEETNVPIKRQAVQSKISEMINKSKTEKQEGAPAKAKQKEIVKHVVVTSNEEQVHINMKERQETLARQLSSINFGQMNDDGKPKPKRKPLPSPIIPLTVNDKENNTPAPLNVVTPVQQIETDEEETPVDVQALEQVHTYLYPQITGPFFMYNKVNWSLEVRKELFTPHEKLETLDPLLITLIFAQIVQDVFMTSCIRIKKDLRLKGRSMLETFGITPYNILTIEPHVQLRVIEEARDWPCYFAKLFAATGGQRYPDVNYVAVSHSGVYLLKREKDLVEDSLDVIDKFRFETIMSVVIPQPYTIQIQVSSQRYVIIYTHKAEELRRLVDAFCIECEKTEMYVRAKKNYQTRESTLLSFEKGDIIKLTNRNMTLDRGWLYGSVHGRAGLFPHDYIEPIPIHEVKKIEDKPRSRQRPLSARDMNKGCSTGSVGSTDSLMLQDGTFTMLEFAMKYFRKSPYRYQMARGKGGSIHGTFKELSMQKILSLERRKKRSSAHGEDWTWKEQVDMIKWTKSPIQISLLELNKEHNKIALECFIYIMRYMGDYPMAKGMGHVSCLLFVLMQCHNKRLLIDEVFCQLIKQTTNNRSTKSDSETMGWRFLVILTSFFDVSDQLRPYFFKYLESVAYDSSRSTQMLAGLCLDNARKTIKYGGRKNVPSKTELESITNGRMTRRLLCVLPGGTPVVLNLRSSNVVADMLEKIAADLGIHDPRETEEYTIFYVIEKEDLYCPLSTTEYIFDMITELENSGKSFYILLQRTTWLFPLHLDSRNPLYIDAMYNQCLPEYLDGNMIAVPNKTLSQPLKDEIALIGALLLCIMERKGTPSQKDTSDVIPQNVQSLADMKLSNWSNQIYHRLIEVMDLTPEEAKIRFLEKIRVWALFGSAFFKIKGISDKRVQGECRLAVNRKGISCLHSKTNEMIVSYPLQEIISTRETMTEKGRHLDIKVGDLMHHSVIQIYTDQVSAIGTLINQYIVLSKELMNR